MDQWKQIKRQKKQRQAVQNLPPLQNLQEQRERVQQQILLREVQREREKARQNKALVQTPHSVEDVELKPAERGLLLGMTEMGKSTLADALIDHSRKKFPDQHIIIFDTKPNYRAQMELNGLPSVLRYRNWDDKKGVYIPGSVAIDSSMDPWSSLKFAWQQKYKVVVAQISKHDDIGWLSKVMRAAYEHKPKNKPLLLDVDETNHWFRGHRGHGNIIIEILTSGRENGVGMLLGGQRPRNISVEAMESMTNLYWFYTPWGEDNKHLKSMGVPPTAQPGDFKTYQFYFYSRRNPNMQGLCKLPKATKEEVDSRARRS